VRIKDDIVIVLIRSGEDDFLLFGFRRSGAVSFFATFSAFGAFFAFGAASFTGAASTASFFSSAIT
jgi:hypothetical protein